jgi:UDP-GlcNAc:undecaprenyl-phosphate GlcNAc-1-phosphate transferase
MWLLAALAACLVTVALIWPLRRLALSLLILDDPGPRKVHTAPVPYLGGVAMLGGLSVAMLWLHPEKWSIVVLLGSVAFIGLMDDIRYLPVWVKLTGETTVAIAAVALGFSWHVSDSVGLNAVFSVVWMVGLTNSFNLLDNMDGLASTVAALALVAVAALVPSTAVIAGPIAGAAVGFLFINRPPARMYMGDAGSLMLGFGIALCTIAAANTAHGLHAAVLLIVPVAVALLDTSLVIVSRLATGRPVQVGGRDHFSHRLRLLGWSRYQVLGAAAVGCGGAWAAAALAIRFPLADAWLAVPVLVAFVIVWVRLLLVDAYKTAAQPALEVRSAHGV